MYDTYTQEQLRLVIDEAVDAWLYKAGLTQEQIHSLDYSFLDNELNDLFYQGSRL